MVFRLLVLLGLLFVGSEAALAQSTSGAPLSGIASAATTAPAISGTVQRSLAVRAADQLNIRDYGALGNTQTFPDGTITAGTATFTSNDNTFTSADVGKIIQIDGAGGTSAAPLVTTIAAYNSAHSVTLASNATATTPQYFLLVRGYGASLTAVTSGTAGSYVPGETVSVTGGTNTAAGVLTVSSTQVRAATIAAAGASGTNGTCTVTGTTGLNGTALSYFTANVTIASNAISAVNSITTGGHYTTNPTTLTAEPVTGCGLVGATLSLSMGVDQAIYSTQGSYTAKPSNPVATGAGSISGATGATFNLSWTTSGTYFYGNDDTAGFNAAIAESNTLYNTGQGRSCIYVPAGLYWVGSSALTQFERTNPGCVRGDGWTQSWFVMGPGISGPLFSWDQAWIPNGQLSDGPTLMDLAIWADNTTTNTQHGAQFLDPNDLALFQNIYMQGLNGSGISIGNYGVSASGYLRESKFYNIRIEMSGNSTYPVVNIGSVCTPAPCTGSDATNELAFYGLDIYGSNGRSLAINNSEQQGATRLIRIFGLRLESALPGFDMLDIGDATDQGYVSSVQIQGLEENVIPVGSMGVRTTAYSAAYSPYQIEVEGVIQTGIGGGIEVDAAGGAQVYRMLGIGVTSATQLNVGSTSKVYAPVVFDGYGQEMYWSTNIASVNAKYVLSPTYKYGPSTIGPNPSSTVSGIVGNLHDGTAAAGNSIGQYANDLQTYRTAATEVASGAQATVAGGGGNTASLTGDTVSGGTYNTASGGTSVVAGGNSNTASGGQATICGGSNHTVTGYRATACGGYGASVAGQYSFDAGGLGNNIGSAGYYDVISGTNGSVNRFNTNCVSAGDFVSKGDMQTCTTVLEAVATTATAVRLTGDGNAAGSTNCVNITNLGSYPTFELVLDIVAIDHNTASNYEVWNLWSGLMSYGTGTTVVTMNTTPTPLTHGTVTGSSIAATADVTNNCLNLTFTPPTGNTDTWHVVAKVHSVETF